MASVAAWPMQPLDRDPTARSRRVHDAREALAGAEEKGAARGLPAACGGVAWRRWLGGGGVLLVGVLAVLGHVGVALLGDVCVTGVAGASPSSLPRCRSARQKTTEGVRRGSRWCWR